MDIQQYISSGIIEQYVLGMVSPSEAAEFEALCKQYPELKKAHAEFELSIEKKAIEDSVSPPPYLKEQILEAIRPSAKVKRISTMQWAIAACIVLTIGFATLIYILNDRNKKLETEIARTQQKLDTIDQQKTAFEASILPDNSVVKHVKVVMPEAMPARINVFWDSTNKHVYLVIRNLAPLPANQKYELWSTTKGKSKSLGLFDAPVVEKLILRLSDAQDAEAFGISISKSYPINLPDSGK